MEFYHDSCAKIKITTILLFSSIGHSIIMIIILMGREISVIYHNPTKKRFVSIFRYDSNECGTVARPNDAPHIFWYETFILHIYTIYYCMEMSHFFEISCL